MLHLLYSNSVEVLVERLAADLRAIPLGAEALRNPQIVLIPNRGLETFVRLSVARANGIAAGLEFMSPALYFRKLVDAVEVGDATHGRAATDLRRLRVLDRGVVHAGLLEHFDSAQSIAAPLYEPIRRYLDVADSPSAREERAFQLAGTLARHFDDYRADRPEMLAAWTQRTVLDDTVFAATEAWQRALWLELFGPEGRFVRDSANRWVMPSDLRDDALTAAVTRHLPAHIRVFGITHLSAMARDFFLRLAERTELSLYTLNPCMEFWEDVPPRWQHPQISARFSVREGAPEPDLQTFDPFGLSRREDTPALQLWGRPGREAIRLLNALSDCDFDGLFVDPRVQDGDSPTLLHRLQGDILFREPPRASLASQIENPSSPEEIGEIERPFVGADASIGVLACPSLVREVEVVASRIVELLQDDPTLRLNDIAVMVPSSQRDAYFARIQSVFSEVHSIPHNAIDLGPSSVSRFVEAVTLLLELPFGTFTREQFLSLLTHPNLKHGLEASPAQWPIWCDELAIIHGADHADHAGTYIELDVFNWDQGMRRLGLGVFIDPETAPELLVDGRESAYVPLGVSADQVPAAAMLIRLVRGLIHEAKRLRVERLPLSEWARRFTLLLGQYLEPRSDVDGRLRDWCLRAIEELKELDLSGVAVSHRRAWMFLRERLAAIESRRGQFLADGVVVSVLTPMRAIPFRVTFVMGLGEGAFPAREPRSPLDLRSAKRRAGDVAQRERDLYLFLETLLCTRDKFFLSYVARDDQTGEKQASSSVIDELLSILGREYLGVDNVSGLVERHPLRRFDERYFGDLSGGEEGSLRTFVPDARHEAHVAALRVDYEAKRGQRPSSEVLQRELSPSVFEALEATLGIHRPPTPSVRSVGDTLSLPIMAVERFLACPLQASARFLLRMRRDESEADRVAREDEPFESESGDTTLLLRDVFYEALSTTDGLKGEQLAALYDARIELLAHLGHFPIGAFQDAQRTKDLHVLAAWRANVWRAGIADGVVMQRQVFGWPPAELSVRATGRHKPSAIETCTHPLVELDVGKVGELGFEDPVHVELNGGCHPIFERDGARVLLWLSPRGRVEPWDFLRGYVEHLFLSRVGEERLPTDVVVVPIHRMPNSVWTMRLGSLTQDQATQRLCALLSEFIHDTHDTLLPIEAVCAAALADQPKNLATEILRLRDDPYASAAFKYGPVRDFQLYEPPAGVDAIVGRRLGDFLAAVMRRRPI
ncbi:MAG: hypothetical protein CO108_00465 [Deltaproteobacteria bacterium CG_4_9_14_3_um_filter_63_12]|nr:MAG: hypothetical protein CO108_00465 [Deltaproteobacteria bacterium CG_4_9_14_3_um_filter_63_12]